MPPTSDSRKEEKGQIRFLRSVDGLEIFEGDQDWQAIVGSGMLIRKQVCKAAGEKFGYSEEATA